ncbi:MAG TPA: VWA domain-containing protein [Pyrinomonadaceae bacterium]|nr:VWA domain-containing protein [Pyrinomonadaceae bacterium]
MTDRSPKIEFFTKTTKLEADREQTVDVLIRITPPLVTQYSFTRPRLNLSIVLDRSGSMGGSKMHQAREAAKFCVDQMLPSDRLSVVIFDEQIDLLFPSDPVTNKESMKDLISRIEARGSTALHEAWVRGGLTVSDELLETGINRVLLITDGQANVGLTNVDEIVTQAMGLFQRGVSTSTIGIGADFNENLLMPMAQSAGGNAWHVAEAEDMQRIFQTELEGLISQFAHTVSLGMIPADGVVISDLLNDFEITETGRYRLPNLQAGAPLEIVAQLKVSPQAAGTKIRLLDLKLGFTPPEARTAEVVKQVYEIEFASKYEVEALPVNYEVVKAVQFLMNARAKREAMNRIDAGDFSGAQHILGESLRQTQLACAPIMSSADVLEECASLSDTKSSLMDRLQDKMSRKRLAYQAYSRRTGK